MARRAQTATTIFQTLAITGLFLIAGCGNPHEYQGQIVVTHPMYVMTVHMDGKSDPLMLEAAWSSLLDLTAHAEAYNMRLNLLFMPDWAAYINSAPDRKAHVGDWKAYGHQIGAHHHEVYNSLWDGYTFFSASEAASIRSTLGLDPIAYKGTMDDLMQALMTIDPHMDMGCMEDELNKQSLPREIIYDLCSGYLNTGEPGVLQSDINPDKAKNEYLSYASLEGRVMVWMTHALLNQNNSRELMDIYATNSTRVISIVVHAGNAAETENMKKFMDLAYSTDRGAKSYTFQGIVATDVLPYRDITNTITTATLEEVMDPDSPWNVFLK